MKKILFAIIFLLSTNLAGAETQKANTQTFREGVELGRIAEVHQVLKYSNDETILDGAFFANERTALMEAAMRGHRQLVKYLIKQGADANLKDAEGKTAADHAKENGFRTTQLLINDAQRRSKK